MTDYKNLKLIATSSPHIRAAENTRSIMLDVIIAMMPALIWAIVKFGFRALTLTAVSVVGCMFFEWGYRKLMKKPQSVNDLSAAVTGILLAFVCPVNMPYWMILVGDFFAIVVVKQLFGGIGKNFMNPALSAWDILEHYRWAERPAQNARPGRAIELDEDELPLYNALLEQELSFDELSALSKFPASKLNSLLTSLELRGIIVKAPGGIYRAYQ